MGESLQQHWETVYRIKQPHEVSWTEQKPQVSLEMIQALNLPKNASIIDIGGGDSRLADFLLAEGFTDITVLDISAESLERAKKRLGEKADLVKWIVSDVRDFTPSRHYDLWHDRATFHFLNDADDIARYVRTVTKFTDKHLVIGTFSDKGPEKCSGLPVRRYSTGELAETFAPGFIKIECRNRDHLTPFNTTQNFSFCSFASKKVDGEKYQ